MSLPADDLQQVLGALDAARSADLQTRTAAEHFLRRAEAANLPLFVACLSTGLCDETRADASRQLAGIMIKNALTARDDALRASRCAAWCALDPAARDGVKAQLLRAMESPSQGARKSAAQAAAAVAVVELPHGQWTGVVPLLVGVSVNPHAPVGTREAALHCLGFLCEELPSEAMDQATTNQVLTAIVNNMVPEQPPDVRLAATAALLNTLAFASANFGTEAERAAIMRSVCAAASPASPPAVRHAALECAVRAVELYYDKMAAHMQDLFAATVAALQQRPGEDQRACLMAIEFWSVLSELESALHDSAVAGSPVCADYVRGALPHIMPLLLQNMCMQDEHQDEDAWNPCMASGVLVALVAECVEEHCMDHVTPWALAHLGSQQWREREAAAQSLGALAAGPAEDVLRPIALRAVPAVAELLVRDPSVAVRDTAAWTLGRFASQCFLAVDPSHRQPLLDVARAALADKPRVAANACYAIASLVGSAHGEGVDVAPWFVPAATDLLKAAERPDWDEHNLRSSAYETVNKLVELAPDQCVPAIKELLTMVNTKLETSIHAVRVTTTDEKREQESLRGFLCGTLQAIVQRLGAEVQPSSDAIMRNLLHVLHTKDSVAQAESLMAIGALADALSEERRFWPYFSHTAPYITNALRAIDNFQISFTAAGVVCDLCRAMGSQAQAAIDEWVPIIVANLANPSLPRGLRAPLISAFADMCMAAEDGFMRHLPAVLPALREAAAYRLPASPDEDLIDFANALRNSTLEAYTGIIQGLSNPRAVATELGSIFSALQAVADNLDTVNDEETIGYALGLVGDLAEHFPVEAGPALRHPSFMKILDTARGYPEDESLREAVQRVTGLMRRARIIA